MDGNWRRTREKRKYDGDDGDEGEGLGGRRPGQNGDEATKSIILLNNKPCCVRFAKITKTTTRPRFCVYAGSFIRALTAPTAISIHPSAARKLSSKRIIGGKAVFPAGREPFARSAGVAVIIVKRIMLPMWTRRNIARDKLISGSRGKCVRLEYVRILSRAHIRDVSLRKISRLRCEVKRAMSPRDEYRIIDFRRINYLSCKHIFLRREIKLLYY